MAARVVNPGRGSARDRAAARGRAGRAGLVAHYLDAPIVPDGALPALPARLSEVCRRRLLSIDATRLPDYIIRDAANNGFCRTCGWLVHEHPDDPPAAAPPVVSAGASAPLEPAGPPIVALVPPTDPAMAFMQLIQAWRGSRFCSDDRDDVMRALDAIETAWFNGSVRVLDNFVIRGPPTIDRTFSIKPSLAAANATRGRELLAGQVIGLHVLRVLRAYARRRVIIDKAPLQVVCQSDFQSDEWFAVACAEKSRFELAPLRPEPSSDAFSGPSEPLWWFLFAASIDHDALQSTLERACRDYGASFRGKNTSTFCVQGVWRMKYRPGAGKRSRSAPADPTTPSPAKPSPVRNAPADPSARSTRAKRRRTRLAAERAAARDAANDSAAEDDAANWAPRVPGGGGASSSTLHPSPHDPPAAGARGGGGGRGRDRGRGRRGRGRRSG